MTFFHFLFCIYFIRENNITVHAYVLSFGTSFLLRIQEDDLLRYFFFQNFIEKIFEQPVCGRQSRSLRVRTNFSF